MKTAIQEAAELYQSKGLVLAQELENYLKFGYVFCTPERLLLANEAKRDGNCASWVAHGEGDCWHVKLAIGRGSVKWFLDKAPYPKKWVAWAREFKTDSRNLHFYDFNRLTHKLSNS